MHTLYVLYNCIYVVTCFCTAAPSLAKVVIDPTTSTAFSTTSQLPSLPTIIVTTTARPVPTSVSTSTPVTTTTTATTPTATTPTDDQISCQNVTGKFPVIQWKLPLIILFEF